MRDAATHQFITFCRCRQIATDEVTPHHLRIRIDKEQPFTLCLIGQTVAYGGSPHIMRSALVMTVREIVDFQIGNVRHLIAPTVLKDDDFILCSRLFQLSVQVLYQLIAGTFVGRYEYGELHLFLNSQKATAEAAATFNESTPWCMGIRTV